MSLNRTLEIIRGMVTPGGTPDLAKWASRAQALTGDSVPERVARALASQSPRGGEDTKYTNARGPINGWEGSADLGRRYIDAEWALLWRLNRTGTSHLRLHGLTARTLAALGVIFADDDELRAAALDAQWRPPDDLCGPSTRIGIRVVDLAAMGHRGPLDLLASSHPAWGEQLQGQVPPSSAQVAAQ